jgi:hypothetical protein
MSISKYLKPYIELFLAAIFLISSFLVGSRFEKPSIFINKQSSSLNIDNKFLANFNLGLKRLISSTLWVSTILESDHDHYKNRDLNSWMFLRFNTMSNLDPHFYEVYAFGGPYLSIIKDDLAGASIIYDKGLQQYPDDFSLLRDAGFHYYFEVADDEKAFPIYNKLKLQPKASIHMVSTLARLNTGKGRLEDAYALLAEQYIKIENKDSAIAKKIKSYLYSIKAEIDTECLNKSTEQERSKCSDKDVEGNSYVFDGFKYKSIKEWTPFRVKRNKVK